MVGLWVRSCFFVISARVWLSPGPGVRGRRGTEELEVPLTAGSPELGLLWGDMRAIRLL